MQGASPLARGSGVSPDSFSPLCSPPKEAIYEGGVRILLLERSCERKLISLIAPPNLFRARHSLPLGLLKRL